MKGKCLKYPLSFYLFPEMPLVNSLLQKVCAIWALISSIYPLIFLLRIDLGHLGTRENSGISEFFLNDNYNGIQSVVDFLPQFQICACHWALKILTLIAAPRAASAIVVPWNMLGIFSSNKSNWSRYCYESEQVY